MQRRIYVKIWALCNHTTKQTEYTCSPGCAGLFNLRRLFPARSVAVSSPVISASRAAAAGDGVPQGCVFVPVMFAGRAAGVHRATVIRQPAVVAPLLSLDDGLAGEIMAVTLPGGHWTLALTAGKSSLRRPALESEVFVCESLKFWVFPLDNELVIDIRHFFLFKFGKKCKHDTYTCNTYT